MRKEIICTVCPRGCLITAEGTDQSVVSLKGEGCVRGRRFAEAEFLHPVRILTSTVRRTDTDTNVLPVRTSAPIPQELLLEAMEQIRTVSVTPPVKIHEVIIPDLLGTGADLIAEKSI